MKLIFKFNQMTLLFLIIIILCLILLSSCSISHESVYFEMLAHGASDPQEPHRIFYYNVGNEYSVAYTFKDSAKYQTAIEDDYLYYAPQVGDKAAPTELRRVDLISGEDIVYNKFYYNTLWQLEAKGGLLYLFCSVDDAADYYIYRITQEDITLCSERAERCGMNNFALGAGSLYYIKRISGSSHTLMNINLDTMVNELYYKDNTLF